jgi:hypothetical protein
MPTPTITLPVPVDNHIVTCSHHAIFLPNSIGTSIAEEKEEYVINISSLSAICDIQLFFIRSIVLSHIVIQLSSLPDRIFLIFFI